MALAAISAFAIMEKVKTGDSFCVSCHLADGKAMHGGKHDAMTAKPARSLAGTHYQLAGGDGQGCYNCHKGESLAGRAEVFTLEIRNTAKHFFATSKEPERARRIIEDSYCLRCHMNIASKSPEYAFHSFKAHAGILKPSCQECHRFHAPQGAEGTFLDKAKIMAQCGICHKAPDQSPFVRRSLGL